jgi:lipoprotein-releasing system permease protein
MIFWYAYRTLTTSKGLFNLSTVLSLLSLSLGIATLITVMSLVSGYERALKSSVFDVVGHILISKSPVAIYSPREEIETLKKNLSIKNFSYSPYIQKEALAVHKGQIQGVLIEGLEARTYKKVSGIDRRLVSGTLDLKTALSENGIYIGVGLAEMFNLKIGDRLNIVVPFSDFTYGIRRTVKNFKVLGFLDLGKYEYNNRYILTEIQNTRDLFEFTASATSGLRLKFSDPEQALKVQSQIIDKNLPYVSQTWKDTNLSLFEAIKIERVIIFLILSIMVIIGAFNLSTGLFLSVYKKTADISVLRALGLKSSDVSLIFIFQGLIIGVAGFILGTFLAYFLIQGLNYILSSGLFLPPEVYKLNKLSLHMSINELGVIFVVLLMMCLLATLSPARRNSKLQPAEGLKYD